MNRGLARLAFARSFPATWTLCAAAVSVWLLFGARGPAAQGLGELPVTLDAAEIERALTRQNLWTGLLLVWAPALLLGAATMVPHWRRDERAWLGSAARGRLTLVASTWAGIAAAAALVLVGCAIGAEFGAGEGPPGRRLSRAARLEPVLLLEGDSSRVERLVGPSGACTVRVPLVAIVGGAPPEVRISAQREQGAATELVRRVPGRMTFELALPAGEPGIELTIERLGPGAGIALGDGIAFATDAASERLTSVELALRAWLAIAAWSALALGLGAWLSGATAVLGTLAIATATWLADAAPAWLPGRDLGAALVASGAGFVPPMLGGPELVAAAACVLLGLGLGYAGLRSWRRT